MQTVVGICFRDAGKIYYFEPGDIELNEKDYVIVETARGIELGEVVLPQKKIDEAELVAPLKKVKRKATLKDREHYEKNLKKEKKAFKIALDMIEKHGLPMKLINVEYTFNHNKIMFYFTAEGRVDFRELVKDLAGIFKTRIELRQIGVRDEAKKLGGIGPCGRCTCCGTFLRDFKPVSIKLAKKQDLSLNPAKISGLCGRLMCCLRFEDDVYQSIKARMPEVGKTIKLEIGEGEVVDRNVIARTVKIEMCEGKCVKKDITELEGYDQE